MSFSARLQAAKQKGFGYVLRKSIEVPLREIGDFITWFYLNNFARRIFQFDEVGLFYTYSLYNTTWRNERMIEASIGKHFVESIPNDADILEVGNTLKYYYSYQGDVVDKYEVAPGVLNVDVAEFHPDKKYDLILSVSTMEHVGFDEPTKDPDKIRASLENLKHFLKPRGKMVVTMPLGYNPSLDQDIQAGRLPFTRTIYMLRIARLKWEEITHPDWPAVRYGYPFPCANWIVIGIIETV